jgi:hypothetical protein
MPDNDNDRIQEALERIRENRATDPPKTERQGHHVRVGGGKDRLKKDFSSSGSKNEESKGKDEKNESQ